MKVQLSPQQVALVLRHISSLLGQSESFRSLDGDAQTRIRSNTETVAAMLEAGPEESDEDPYAISYAGLSLGGRGSRFGAVTSPESTSDFGTAAQAGVGAAVSLIQEVSFPDFVSSLIKGVFNAIVQSSIDQMKAYGELVQSVVMSMEDFRDLNVSDNQARDHLVSKYPNLMQMNVMEGLPTVSAKDSAGFDDLPDFVGDLGLSSPISSLDDDVIEQQLVPAARNELARSRQQLLATMVLMGINRIIVTDGRINAKVKFSFKAKDVSRTQGYAQQWDQVGTIYTESDDGTTEVIQNTNAEDPSQQSTVTNITKGYESSTVPDIRLASVQQSTDSRELDSQGQVTGEVAINFRSETFPLEQLVSASNVTRLNQLQGGAGRGVPKPGGSTDQAAGSTSSAESAG